MMCRRKWNQLVLGIAVIGIGLLIPISAAASSSSAIHFISVASVGQTLPVPNGILFGTKWGPPQLGTPATVTWSFQTTGGSPTPLSSFMPNGYADEIRQAFQTWSNAANIKFVEVPSGGQIKMAGAAIDGPGGTAGTGQFPGSGSSTVTFDSANSWSLTPNSGGGYIYQTALHEIGHAIGLAHPPNISAAMNHVISSSFEGLLPTDVAGVQAIYGPAPGINNSLYLPSHVSELTVDPSSQVTVTLTLFNLITLSQTTSISGTIDARIDGLSAGAPTGLTFFGSDLSLNDLSINVNNPFLTGSASFHGLVANLFSKDWFGPTGHLTPINSGEFAVDANVVGLVGGTAHYAINVPSASINVTGDLDLGKGENTGPVSFASASGGLLGSISHVGQGFDLSIPLFVQSTIDLPAGGNSIPLQITVSGKINASVAVPEPSSMLLVALGLMAIICPSVSRFQLLATP